jgi:uncharacterized protein
MERDGQFFEAVKGGDLDETRRLLDEDPGLFNLRSAQGHSPLMLAVYYNKIEMVDLLLSYEPELDIFEAAAVGRMERVGELLDQDPERANTYAPDGFQPLGLACFFGHASVVRVLLERGAAVDSPSQNAQHVSPLNSAAAGRHVEAARLLLEGGADPNIRQAGSHTPLHSAAQNGDMEMARLLVKHGADANLENDAGQTPEEMAAGMEHQDLAEFLRGARQKE